MSKGFPPSPIFPKGFDDDYTLFMVYDTSETITTVDNPPWSEEISIVPVKAGKSELWADNGFANIEGELFYYDAVEKNSDGKVYKLKQCIRNLGGKKTKFNSAGSEVRGFVVAEHHNQLVDAILKLEGFIGENFTEDKTTLDWRIRNLRNLSVIFDDFTCPDITFQFNTLEDDPSSGVLISYTISIQGEFNSYRLDFGDGNFTTTETTGTHRYAPNSTIDPVVTVSNNRCSIVQTPIERTSSAEPPLTETTEPFEIKVPTVPEIPNIIIPDISVPDVPFQPPPIVFPCLDIGPIGPISIPSVIVVDPPINIPSSISITPVDIPSSISISPIDIPSVISVDFPSVISTTLDVEVSIPSLIEFGPVSIPSAITITPITLPSLIEFGPVDIPTLISVDFPSVISADLDIDVPSIIEFGPVDIPTQVTFGPVSIPTEITFGAVSIPSVIAITPVNIPSVISFGPVNIPSQISFGPAPTISAITWGTPPSIPSITFGTPPTISVDWGTPPTCTVSIVCPSSGPAFRASRVYADDFVDSFEEKTIKAEAEYMGIPSEIYINAPEIEDIRILHDIPVMIELKSPNIPSIIKIEGPSTPIPSVINVESSIPSIIQFSGPRSITLDASDVPTIIQVMPSPDFPTSIKIDGSSIPDKIQVVGIPDSIELIGEIPTKIELTMPEKPEVEMVYRGSPIDVKVQLDVSKLTGDGDYECVALVPCKPK